MTVNTGTAKPTALQRPPQTASLAPLLRNRRQHHPPSRRDLQSAPFAQVTAVPSASDGCECGDNEAAKAFVDTWTAQNGRCALVTCVVAAAATGHPEVTVALVSIVIVFNLLRLAMHLHGACAVPIATAANFVTALRLIMVVMLAVCLATGGGGGGELVDNSCDGGVDDQQLQQQWEGELMVNVTAVAVGGIAFVALDFVDGWLARALGEATAFGAAFDEQTDALATLACAAWIIRDDLWGNIHQCRLGEGRRQAGREESVFGGALSLRSVFVIHMGIAHYAYAALPKVRRGGGEERVGGGFWWARPMAGLMAFACLASLAADGAAGWMEERFSSRKWAQRFGLLAGIVNAASFLPCYFEKLSPLLYW